jgi:hypothetical protein
MKQRLRHHGFSLTEVLLAAGILVVGFLLICGTLPVGIHLTTKGTERSIGAVVADEAFAKVRLFGIQPVEDWPAPASAAQGMPVDPNVMHVDYWDITRKDKITNAKIIALDEFAYPSTDIRPDTKKYYWSAILRHCPDEFGVLPNAPDPLDADVYYVTVFVSRGPGAGVKYPVFDRSGRLPIQSPFPRPVLIKVDAYDPDQDPATPLPPMWDQIWPLTNPNDPDRPLDAITEDSILVDDRTGQIMRVLERRNRIGGQVNDPPVILRLDGMVFDTQIAQPRHVWVVPPAVGGGRYPGVAVYQRMVKFNQP